MKKTLKEKLSSWLRPRLRLYTIYLELGYNPWRKPRKARKKGKGVYFGVKEAIPFVNGDAKRTFSHLLFRPGYMMRDYILRGQHEKYLAPFTALLVFYSFFTLLVAVVQPKEGKGNFVDEFVRGFQDVTVKVDSLGIKKGDRFILSLVKTMQKTLLVTRLDRFPEAVDTPWKESLAAVEGDLRSKAGSVSPVRRRHRPMSFASSASSCSWPCCSPWGKVPSWAWP